MHFLKILLEDMLHGIRENSERNTKYAGNRSFNPGERKRIRKTNQEGKPAMTAVQQSHPSQSRLVSEDGGLDHMEKNFCDCGKAWELINDRKHRN